MKEKRLISLLLSLTVLLYVFNGCAEETRQPKPGQREALLSNELLNSERIEMKFGSYGIEVLHSDSALRVSNLFSVHEDEEITRTFAVVHYPEMVDSVFLEEHLQVLGGQSIGKVFKQGGWEIEKRNLFFSEILPSADYSGIYMLMGNIEPTKLAIYTYRFSVKKDNNSFDYAVISEVYHPDYLTLTDLKKMNEDASNYLETLSFTQILDQVERKMKVDYK